MREVALKEIKGIKLQPYQEHPRILELRIMYVHNFLTEEYGDVFATMFFKNWCELQHINWTIIAGILTQKESIRHLNFVDRHTYRQELIFMGVLFNENRAVVAKKYLGVSKTYIYRKDLNFNPEDFVTPDWLNGLDNHVSVCGIPAYLHEAQRFLETLDTFMEVLGYVSMAKTRL